MPGVRCSVAFPVKGIEWTWRSTRQVSVDNTSQEVQSIFEASDVTFSANCTYIEVLQIITKEPVQSNGKIRLDFPGPIPGSAIPIEHTFGIYVIDQVKKENYTLAFPANKSNPFSAKVTEEDLV